MKKFYIIPQTTSIDLMHELNIMQVGGSITSSHEKEPEEGADDIKEDFSMQQSGSLWDEEW